MYIAGRNDNVTLVDLSATALDLATENFRCAGLRAPATHQADAADTGLPTAAYDCVYNIGLLEHFEDPTPVLAESLRLLAPGGLLFMVIIPEGLPWKSMPIRDESSRDVGPARGGCGQTGCAPIGAHDFARPAVARDRRRRPGHGEDTLHAEAICGMDARAWSTGCALHSL